MLVIDFFEKDHKNYCGNFEQIGDVLISLKFEPKKGSSLEDQWRIIMRMKEVFYEVYFNMSSLL